MKVLDASIRIAVAVALLIAVGPLARAAAETAEKPKEAVTAVNAIERAPFIPASAAQLKARTLVFPDDRSLGKVSVGDPGAKGKEVWKALGEAKGKVEIPAGKAVSLRVSEEGAKDLSPLAKFKADDLQILSLRKIKPVDDKALENIKGLTGLQGLVLSGTGITDAGVAVVKEMKDLEWLDISNVKITGAALENLKELKNLKRLDLAGSRINDAGLANLKDLTKLETLYINRNRSVGDLGMGHLAGLKSLKELSIASTRVTDKGLEALKDLPLETLSIRADPKITAKSLPVLAQMKSLKVLQAQSSKLAAAGAPELQKALPNAQVVLKQPKKAAEPKK
jgi:hypothetical protein